MDGQRRGNPVLFVVGAEPEIVSHTVSLKDGHSRELQSNLDSLIQTQLVIDGAYNTLVRSLRSWQGLSLTQNFSMNKHAEIGAWPIFSRFFYCVNSLLQLTDKLLSFWVFQ